MRVKVVDNYGVEPFTVALKRVDGEWLGQFTLHVPGQYQLQVGNIRKSFEVIAHRDLSFGVEFGLTALLVLLAFGGAIAWTLKRKRLRAEKAGSF